MPRRTLYALFRILMVANAAFGQSFQKEYFVAGSQLVTPYSLAQRPDGNFLVSHLVREDSLRLHVSCINSTGDVVWSTRLHAHFAGDQASEGIKKTPVMATADNSCVVLVAKSLVTTGQGWALIKLSPDGTVQWTRYISGVGSVNDLLGYANGRIYVLARYWSFDSRPYMACLDDNGNVIWEKNIQSHLDNVTSTGMRILPDQRILVNLAESSFLQQTGHVARLSTDGALIPLLSLPNLSIMAADEHPDGRLFFTARTLDSISLKNFVLLGAAQNGQVQWIKVIGVPHDFYTSGMLGFNAAKDSVIVSFRPTFFEAQRYWMQFDLNGNPGAAHFIPAVGGFENEVIAVKEGGYAWLSTHPAATNVTSFVLAKTDAQARLPDCDEGSLCGLTMRDTFFPAISVAEWPTQPIANIIAGTTTQVPRTLTAENFCIPLPILDAGIVAEDSSSCGDDPFRFDRLPGITGLSNWHFSGGTPAVFTGATPPNVVFPNAGVFQAQHILNHAGCLDSAELEVHVSDFPVLELPADTVICPGEFVFLNVNALPGLTYQWEDGSSDPAREVTEPGTYALTATTPEGCSTRDSVQVSPLEIPGDVMDSHLFFCPQQAVSVSLVNSPGWQIEWADGHSGQTRIFDSPGVFYIKARSPEQCVLTDSVTVSERIPPLAGIAVVPAECGPRTLQITDSAITMYRWSSGDTTASITAIQSGLYAVTVSDGFCSDADSVQIEILPCPECFVFVPNVFRPASGTGVFIVQSGCALEQFHLAVFDRWGAIVFESKDPGTAWDGTNQGRLLPPGVYTYRLQLMIFPGDTPYSFSKTGDVTIVR